MEEDGLVVSILRRMPVSCFCLCKVPPAESTETRILSLEKGDVHLQSRELVIKLDKAIREFP